MLACSLGTKEAQESWGKDRRLKSRLVTALAELENPIACTYVCTHYFLGVESEGARIHETPHLKQHSKIQRDPPVKQSV